jgi:P-type Cu2+ transporter
MSCCAPGTEAALEAEQASHSLPSREELWLASRDLGQGERQTDLSVPGVYCGACILTVENALKRQKGIVRARVNLSSKRVSFVWREEVDGRRTDPLTFASAIANTGYEAHLFVPGEDESRGMLNQLLRAVAVAGFAAANIMLLSVSVWSGAEAATRDMFHWISAMIAGPALIYSGRFFFISAGGALKHGRANMDVPISLAVILAYGMSLWETMHHGAHAWFDASVTLLFFLLIGRTLDHMMRDRARSAITGLAKLSPRGAMIVTEEGGREYRPIEDVRPGDRIAVAAGERVPVDGVVENGVSDLDKSIVTGESVPVRVVAGDALQAGVVNLTGPIVLKATATARDSFLAEIIGLMESAEGGRARYRRIADRAAEIYAPAVHLLAFGAFLFWGLYGGDWKHALLVAIAVLIITCPCALGLAVPVVQVVAAGRLFKNGIMVKDGSAMERLAEIDTVLFDKTGTLTAGRPELVGRDELNAGYLDIAAGLARHSNHPLSAALARQGRAGGNRFDAIREIPGAGLEADTGEGTYRLGSRRFACGEGVSAATSAEAYSEVVLSLDGRELEVFRFRDHMRADAGAVLTELAARGMRTAMISGDREPVVKAFAARLGIADWQAEMSPKDKAEHCAALKTEGRTVLMVGDGINDAPALSAAHVSMAPATAADIGRQAADFVFMHESLEAVPLAIAVSRRAGRLIRENFGLAIVYNVIAVPIALTGLATPLIAAIAMSSSSIIVVLNALRLNRLGRSKPQADAKERAGIQPSPGTDAKAALS